MRVISPRCLAALFVCLLATATARAQAPAAAAGTVEKGDVNGAKFRIEIPSNWNRGLVLYAHGYMRAGTPLLDSEGVLMKTFRDVFLTRGFAFAQSDYRTPYGWAVKEGIEDTEALRQYFVRRHGAPAETFILGHSMGGHIAIATIERYPEAYQGALPMCGPLGSAIGFFNTGTFDMLVTFEALFPGTIGSPYEPAAATAEKVRAAIAADPQKAARYAQVFSRPVESLPLVLAFFHEIVGEVKRRAGGEPFDNRNRIYVGFGDDITLNRTVRRYAADPAARDYVRQYASLTGRTSDPVLTLHTTADPLVLGSDVTEYETLATIAGTQDLFVARFVAAAGHCSMTPAHIGAAFDALVTWVREKKRPEPGEQK